MKTSVQLRQERQVEIDAQKEIVKNAVDAAGNKRDLTDDETASFRASQTKIDSLNGKISDAENYERNLRDAAAQVGSPVGGDRDNEDGEAREMRTIFAEASIGRALRSLSGGRSLDGVEAEMHAIGTEENRTAGVETPENAVLNIPMQMLRASQQTVSEDAGAFGAALVQDQAPRVQFPFAPSSVLERLGATRLSGLTGGKVPLPVANNYEFSWLGETEAITPQKKEFGGPELSPNRLGAAVDISNRLINQSSPNVEAMIRSLIIAGYDRALNTAAINGSGASNQPTGVLNTAGVQVSAITAGEAASRKAIVELQSLLATADSTTDSLAYIMTHLLRGDLMSRKADAGSGLYLQNDANNLAGYTSVASSFVPQLGGLETMIFGDWTKLFLGEWGALSVVSDPYGALLQNSMRLVLNGHADVAIAQPNAFAVNKFMDASAA